MLTNICKVVAILPAYKIWRGQRLRRKKLAFTLLLEDFTRERKGYPSKVGASSETGNDEVWFIVNQFKLLDGLKPNH